MEDIFDSEFAEFFGQTKLPVRRITRKLQEAEYAERVVQTGDKPQAAAQAGLSSSPNKDTLSPRGEANLTLAKRRVGELARMRITTEHVLDEYARIAFFDIRKLFDETGKLLPVHQLDDDTAAAIIGLDVKVLGKDDNFAELVKYKMADKKAALDALAKRLGLFDETQKILIEGNIGIEKMSKNERARRIAFLLEQAVQKHVSNLKQQEAAD